MEKMIPIIKGLVDAPTMTLGALIGDNIPLIIYEIIEIFYDTWNLDTMRNTRNYIKSLDEMFISAVNEAGYLIFDERENKYLKSYPDTFDMHDKFNSTGEYYTLIPSMHEELFLKSGTMRKSIRQNPRGYFGKK